MTPTFTSLPPYLHMDRLDGNTPPRDSRFPGNHYAGLSDANIFLTPDPESNRQGTPRYADANANRPGFSHSPSADPNGEAIVRYLGTRSVRAEPPATASTSEPAAHRQNGVATSPLSGRKGLEGAGGSGSDSILCKPEKTSMEPEAHRRVYSAETTPAPVHRYQGRDSEPRGSARGPSTESTGEPLTRYSDVAGPRAPTNYGSPFGSHPNGEAAGRRYSETIPPLSEIPHHSGTTRHSPVSQPPVALKRPGPPQQYSDMSSKRRQSSHYPSPGPSVHGDTGHSGGVFKRPELPYLPDASPNRHLSSPYSSLPPALPPARQNPIHHSSASSTHGTVDRSGRTPVSSRSNTTNTPRYPETHHHLPPPLPLARPHAQQPRSEKEKMLTGEEYRSFDTTLTQEREACAASCYKYNMFSTHPASIVSAEERARLLSGIFHPRDVSLPAYVEVKTEAGAHRVGANVVIEAPFNCDYGYNISLGHGVMIGRNCSINDACEVRIGNNCVIGPNVCIYTAELPIDPRKRQNGAGLEVGKPVIIQPDCWIAGSATILPGCTIGEGSTVGAGSTVIRDVPPYTVVAGNPARILHGVASDG